MPRLPVRRRYYLLPIAVILFGAVGWYIYQQFQTPILPKNVTAQVSFVIYYPGKPWIIEQKTATYAPKSQILNFHAKNGSTDILFNEQATPSQFSDIPAYFPALLDRLNSYQTISSLAGDVHLTHPTELDGAQSAVLSNNGTLLFAQPNKALSDDDWRRLFNNVSTLRP